MDRVCSTVDVLRERCRPINDLSKSTPIGLVMACRIIGLAGTMVNGVNGIANQRTKTDILDACKVRQAVPDNVHSMFMEFIGEELLPVYMHVYILTGEGGQ